MNFHWLSLKSTYNFQTVIIISQPPDFGRACQMQSFWPKQKAGGKLCRKLNPWMTLRLITKRPGVWICRNRILNKRFPYMTASKNEALSVITSWLAAWAGTAFGKSSAVYGHIDTNEGFVRKSEWDLASDYSYASLHLSKKACPICKPVCLNIFFA